MDGHWSALLPGASSEVVAAEDCSEDCVAAPLGAAPPSAVAPWSPAPPAALHAWARVGADREEGGGEPRAFEGPGAPRSAVRSVCGSLSSGSLGDVEAGGCSKTLSADSTGLTGPALEVNGLPVGAAGPPGALRKQLVADLEGLLQQHNAELTKALEGWMERQEQMLAARAAKQPPPPPPVGMDLLPPSPGLALTLNREHSMNAARDRLRMPISRENSMNGAGSRLQTPSSREHSMNPGGDRSVNTSEVQKDPMADQSRFSTMTASRLTMVSTFAEAMKLKRQQSLHPNRRCSTGGASTTQPHSTKSCRNRMATFMHSNFVETVVIILIISNALFTGVEVEILAHSQLDEPPFAIRLIAHAYTVIFTVELLLRMFVDGADFCRSKNWGWNCLDSAIVCISLVEVALDGSVTNGGSGKLTYIRIVRISRAVRIFRVVRIMKYFRSLRILVYSVMNTLRSLFWTLLLLLLLLYLFGVLFTQAVTSYLVRSDGGVPEGEALQKHYGTLGRSVFTLFLSISGGLDWAEVVEPLGTVDAIWAGFFLLFISFAYFALLNVVTGVFCQTAIESANQDQDMVIQGQLSVKQQYITQFQLIFRHIDIHNTGQITLGELEERLQDEKLQAFFSSMELTVDEAFSLFQLLDVEDAHVIDVDHFVTGCLRLRGSARKIDIAMLMHENRWTMHRLTHVVKSFEERIQALQAGKGG